MSISKSIIRDDVFASSEGTASNYGVQVRTKQMEKTGENLPIGQVISEADSNLPICMCRDSQSCLPIYTPFAKIFVLLWTGIHNFHVNPLTCTWPNIGCHDHECVWMCRIPYAFLWRVAICLESEFDSIGWCRLQK